jgi:hypothetical protein
MKLLLFIFTLLFSFNLAPCEEQKELYEKLYANSIENVTLAIKLCNKARIYLLDGKTITQDEDPEGFPVKPYGKVVSKILKDKYLDHEELEKLKGSLVLLTKNQSGEQALCHYPGFGIRLYSDKTLIFETSICFKCNNWQLPVLSGHTWASLPDENTSKELLQALKTLFPDQ